MHIIGAGGHAKVIIDILLDTELAIVCVYDEKPDAQPILGQPIVGNLAYFKSLKLSPAIIAIGNNMIRKKLVGELACEFGNAIHPKSAISRAVTLGKGTVIMANATINPGCKIGEHVIINTNATVDHDCIIGDFVHISPLAALAGGVEVGEGSHIGIGAAVIQMVKIGKWVTVGAGTVVLKDVPDYAVVVGNPGRIIKYNSPT